MNMHSNSDAVDIVLVDDAGAETTRTVFPRFGDFGSRILQEIGSAVGGGHVVWYEFRNEGHVRATVPVTSLNPSGLTYDAFNSPARVMEVMFSRFDDVVVYGGSRRRYSLKFRESTVPVDSESVSDGDTGDGSASGEFDMEGIRSTF